MDIAILVMLFVIILLLTAIGGTLYGIKYILLDMLEAMQAPALQSSEPAEQLKLVEESRTLTDVILERFTKKKFDPTNIGTFKGRQPWR